MFMEQRLFKETAEKIIIVVFLEFVVYIKRLTLLFDFLIIFSSSNLQFYEFRCDIH